MKLLVLNGPNLNFLGIREKNIYGNMDYNGLIEYIKEKIKKIDKKIDIDIKQSNSEGILIDMLQQAYFDKVDGIIINPGAYTHYSYAIFDAIKSIQIPTVEVHISNIHEREDFRKISVTAPACVYQIYGKEIDGYIEAVLYLQEYLK